MVQEGPLSSPRFLLYVVRMQDAGNRTRVAVRHFINCHILSNLSGHQGSNLSIQLFINIALYKFTTELRHVVTIYTNSMTGSSCKYLFLVSFYLLSCFCIFFISWCPHGREGRQKIDSLTVVRKIKLKKNQQLIKVALIKCTEDKK